MPKLTQTEIINLNDYVGNRIPKKLEGWNEEYTQSGVKLTKEFESRLELLKGIVNSFNQKFTHVQNQLHSKMIYY